MTRQSPCISDVWREILCSSLSISNLEHFLHDDDENASFPFSELSLEHVVQGEQNAHRTNMMHQLGNFLVIAGHTLFSPCPYLHTVLLCIILACALVVVHFTFDNNLLALPLSFLSIAIFDYYFKNKYTLLKNTNSQLKQCLQLREDKMKRLSHDFRTACMSCVGSIELMKESFERGGISNGQSELLNQIESSHSKILLVIQDMLQQATPHLEHSTHEPQ